MKRIILIFIVSITIGIPVIACDVCGSGTGTSYMGLLPEFKKRFIGLRYQHSSLLNHLGAGGNPTYLTATERFNSAELWGAINIGKKIRVSAFIPYHFISRENHEGKSATNGIGDITAVGFYQVLNKQKERSKTTWTHSLWLGGGVKLPTGKYNPEDKNIQQAGVNTFQLGTGSTDLSLHAMYDVSVNKVGLNVNAGYKINTANKYEYRYGNKLTINSLFYYKVNQGKAISITPNAGILLETASKDWKTKDIQVWETGGYSINGTIGTELNFGRFSVGANFQVPLAQKLGEGKVEAKNRGMAHISFSF